MNEKLLKEYIDRVGLVTSRQLVQRMGLAGQSWQEPAAKLMSEREFFICRLDHGAQTFVSRHLFLCLQAVYTEPALSSGALELYDWLCDHELSSKRDMLCLSGVAPDSFKRCFQELQQKLCIAPLLARLVPQGVEDDELDVQFDFLWVTSEYWLHGLYRPTRYGDLSYCLSEIRRLMGPRFTKGELDQLIYHGDI